MEEKAAKLLALKAIKGYGNQKIIDLVSSYGNIERAYNRLLDNNKIDEGSLKKYEEELIACANKNIKVITYFDKNYPSILKRISSPPLVLFVKGNIELLKMPQISIVGTRDASKKSLEWVYNTSKELANLGYVIVSGGALGTDFSAHSGALDSTGNTICVLGSGFDNIYPKENKNLIENISKKGLIISEFPPDQHVTRVSLLERNRITSGLGAKVLVVATKQTGGTMSQYKIALTQKKEIYYPHPDLGLGPSEGINQIMKENTKVLQIRDIKQMFKCLHRSQCESQRVLEPCV